jgi:hypothetical protein
VCTSLQLKGFSIQPDKRERVTAVELFRGGSSIGVLEPRDFSPAARLAYSPSAYESSNSGFNGSFDISSWPLGQNVVEVKAYSPDGAVTSSGTITVTRAATGCSDPLADPAPSGEPAAMDAPDIARPTATPIPTFKKPLIRKASISKAGVLTLLVTDANDRGRSCSVSLAVSSKPTSSFRVVKALTTKYSTYSATLSGSRIKSGPLKRAYLRISKSCAYGSGATTAQLTFQQSGKGKIGTLSKLANHLRGLP